MFPQSSSIAFALIVGFVVFVTVRGELPKYLAVIGLGNGGNLSMGSTTQPTASAGSTSSTEPAQTASLSALPSLPDLIDV